VEEKASLYLLTRHAGGGNMYSISILPCRLILWSK